jgi:hypothetical protein
MPAAAYFATLTSGRQVAYADAARLMSVLQNKGEHSAICRLQICRSPWIDRPCCCEWLCMSEETLEASPRVLPKLKSKQQPTNRCLPLLLAVCDREVHLIYNVEAQDVSMKLMVFISQALHSGGTIGHHTCPKRHDRISSRHWALGGFK